MVSLGPGAENGEVMEAVHLLQRANEWRMPIARTERLQSI